MKQSTIGKFFGKPAVAQTGAKPLAPSNAARQVTAQAKEVKTPEKKRVRDESVRNSQSKVTIDRLQGPLSLPAASFSIGRRTSWSDDTQCKAVASSIGCFMLQVPASAASSPHPAPAAAPASPAAVKADGKSRLKRLKKNPSAEAKAAVEVRSPVDDSDKPVTHLLSAPVNSQAFLLQGRHWTAWLSAGMEANFTLQVCRQRTWKTVRTPLKRQEAS